MKAFFGILAVFLISIGSQARIACLKQTPIWKVCQQASQKHQLAESVAEDLLRMLRSGISPTVYNNSQEPRSTCTDKLSGTYVCGVQEIATNVEDRVTDTNCAKFSGRQICLKRSDRVELLDVRPSTTELLMLGERDYLADYMIIKANGHRSQVGHFGFVVYPIANSAQQALSDGYEDARNTTGCGWFDYGNTHAPSVSFMDRSCWSSTSR